MMAAPLSGRGVRRAANALIVLLALLAAPGAFAQGAVPDARPQNANPPAATSPSATSPSANSPSTGQAAPADSSNGAALLEAFDRQQNQRVNGASALTDKNKHFIMFSLSLPLFILLLITAGLGIATGVFGKKLYIPHMIFAGLTVTVALAHAIAGIVWFFPF